MQYEMFDTHWCAQFGGHSPIHHNVHTNACKIFHTAYISAPLSMNPGGSKHKGENRNKKKY
jgi:hypothetical protein